MTERWISTKKHYCKYCNTWIPDTKLSRTQHEASDRHKNAMRRNLTRLQRDELIKRQAGGNIPASSVSAGKGGRDTSGLGKKGFANYGYGEREDMIGFIKEGRKIKFDEIPQGGPMMERGDRGLKHREGNVGKWEVTQIISNKVEEEEGKGEVKEEDVGEEDTKGIQGRGVTREDGQKRERKRTPDVEDLSRFRVEEKMFPVEIKEEGEETKVPVVGFKKRKIGIKNARVSGAL